MEKFLKGMFLGPQAENAPEFETLILEVLRDHVFWRRNFHPGDPRLIKETEKFDPEFASVASNIRDNLFKILARIKRGAPHYSPRQIAHIVGDPTMPSLIGYFAGMLYNQNNVVEEASPETLKQEGEYMSALASMVNYPEFVPRRFSENKDPDRNDYSWGHLCSGGTTANLESLWVVRNIKFFPHAVKMLSGSSKEYAFLKDVHIKSPSGIKAKVRNCNYFELMNMRVPDLVDFIDLIYHTIKDDEVARRFDGDLPSVKNLGMANFLERYTDMFPEENVRMPVILISQAQHYCWKKNADVIGIGSDCIINIPADEHIRMDMKALKNKINELSEERIPILQVVSILGTTEEASIDPLHKIDALRTEFERKDITYWHHSDAALGGYFTSMIPRGEDGKFKEFSDLDNDENFLSEQVYKGICGAAKTDSMAIDPHKFGYVPYPCGAIMFKNYRVRDFIAYEAPYLATPDNVGFGGFIGQWTLEGSRPGAMALSCALEQSVMSLDDKGHGVLIKYCIKALNGIVDAMIEKFNNNKDSDYSIVPFTEPDTTGYCFMIVPKDGIADFDSLNNCSKNIWSRMTVDDSSEFKQYDFLISKTGVEIESYNEVLRKAFKTAGIEFPAHHEGKSLTLLRIFIMNSIISAWEEFPEMFSERIYRVADEVYCDLLP